MNRRRWMEVFLVLLVVIGSVSVQRRLPEQTPVAKETAVVLPTPRETEPPQQPWEPFTAASRAGIVGAQTHAEKDNSDVIDCHYLVLGLRDNDEELQRYLADVALASISNPKPGKAGNELVFQLEAKRAIEFAFEEARLRESSTIDTTHLFCGVLRTDSETRRSLNRQGINLEGYRKRLGWE